MKTAQLEKTLIKPGVGLTPAVALVNPKYGHNVAGALRACSCWGIRQMWVTGERVLDEWQARGRLPREERMKAYGSVDVCLGDYFFDAYERGSVTPVGVELSPSAEVLTLDWEHPEDALYVFGPEDGSLPKSVRLNCHRQLILPSDHCMNLASAVNAVLMHRRLTRQYAGLEPVRASRDMVDEEHRGWLDSDEELS